MFEVLGNASLAMIGRIDWDPHLAVMYARLMKGLRLPVYFKQANNNLETQPVKSFTFSTAARWIIGTLVSTTMSMIIFSNPFDSHLRQNLDFFLIVRTREIDHKLLSI